MHESFGMVPLESISFIKITHSTLEIISNNQQTDQMAAGPFSNNVRIEYRLLLLKFM